MPLGNDTLKTVLFGMAASMTACKSQLSWWYDERTAVYPDNISSGFTTLPTTLTTPPRAQTKYGASPIAVQPLQ